MRVIAREEWRETLFLTSVCFSVGPQVPVKIRHLGQTATSVVDYVSWEML